MNTLRTGNSPHRFGNLISAVVIWILIGFGYAPTTSAQCELLPDNWAIFGCNNFAGRFLAIHRFGNNKGRNDEITILELVEPDKRIRVLHQLVTKCPFGLHLVHHSNCGRFVITNGERLGTGMSERELVIYDLVRKEQSAYGIQDFLPEATIASLERSDMRQGRGLRWSDISSFDPVKMEFYPSRPQDCRKSNLPFVVMDLLSRQVSVKPVPEGDFARWWPDCFFEDQHLRCSAGDQPIPSADAPLILPPYLRVEFGPQDNRERRVFRLDNESGDYLAVPETDWPDERLPLIVNGMYGFERTKPPTDKAP